MRCNIITRFMEFMQCLSIKCLRVFKVIYSSSGITYGGGEPGRQLPPSYFLDRRQDHTRMTL